MPENKLPDLDLGKVNSLPDLNLDSIDSLKKKEPTGSGDVTLQPFESQTPSRSSLSGEAVVESPVVPSSTQSPEFAVDNPPNIAEIKLQNIEEGTSKPFMDWDKKAAESSFDYILADGLNNSLIGMAYKAKEGRPIMTTDIADYQPSTPEKVASMFTSLVIDLPSFGPGGSIGGGIAKTGVGMLAKSAVKKAVSVAVKEGMTEAAAKEFIKQTAKNIVTHPMSVLSQSAAQGAGALGAYDAARDVLTQIGDGADPNDVDWGQTAKAFGKGSILGGIVGGIGYGTAMASKAATKAFSGLTEKAAKAAINTTGFGVENVAFVTGGAMLEGKKWKDITNEDWIMSFATLGGLKGIHAAGKFIKSNNFTSDKANKGEFKIEFTPEELRSMGEGAETKWIETPETFLKDPQVPQSAKIKIAWATEGIRPSVIPAIDGVVITPVGEKFNVTTNNNKGEVVTSVDYATMEEANSEAIRAYSVIKDAKLNNESAELTLQQKAEVVEQSKSAGIDLNEVNEAKDKEPLERNQNETKAVQEFNKIVTTVKQTPTVAEDKPTEVKPEIPIENGQEEKGRLQVTEPVLGDKVPVETQAPITETKAESVNPIEVPKEEPSVVSEKPVTPTEGNRGKIIEPHKEVSISQVKAVEDVVSGLNTDMKPMEASMLYSTVKDMDLKSISSENGTEVITIKDKIKEKLFKSLDKKGYVSSFGDGEYSITPKGEQFIERVKKRTETRKGVKDGTDLFPDMAGIPEFKPIYEEIKTQVSDGTIKRITDKDVNELESVTADIERKAESADEAGLVEAIKQADELITEPAISEPAAAKHEPEPVKVPSLDEQMNAIQERFARREITMQEMNKLSEPIRKQMVEEGPRSPEPEYRPGDFLRKLKVVKGAKDLNKFQFNPLGIPIVMWDGLIETVAKSIDAGASIGKAIRTGLDEIRKSDWYKNLGNKQKKESESIFIDYINQEFKKTTPPTDQEANAAFDLMKKQESIAQKSLLRQSAQSVKRMVPRVLFDISYNAKRFLEKTNPLEGLRAKDLFQLLVGSSGNTVREVSKAKEYVLGSLIPGKESIMSHKEQALLGEYLNAQRTIELDNLYDSRGELRLKHPGDMTKELYEKKMELWKSNTNGVLKSDFGIEQGFDFSKIEQAANKYHELLNGKLQEMFENDLLTPEAYDKLSKEQANYSPREFLNFIDSSPTLDGSLSGIKTLKEGSYDAIIKDPALLLSHVIARVNRRIAKNKADKSLSEFHNSSPDNGVVINAKPSQEYIDKVGKAKEELIQRQSQTSIIPTDAKVEYVPIEWEQTPRGYKPIDFLVEGKEKRVFVEDWFKDEWDNTSIPEWYRVTLNILSWATGTKILKMAATGYNPSFPLTNTPLDMFHIATTTDAFSPHLPIATVQMITRMVMNAKDIGTRSGKFDEYVKRGGYTDMLTAQGGIKYKADKYGIRSEAGRFIKQAASYPGETSEIATRLALYDQYVLNGFKEFAKKRIQPTEQQIDRLKDHAVSMSRQYLNFSDHGYLTQFLDAIIPYFGAGVQVTRGTVRYARNNPKMFAYKSGQILAVSSVLAAWNLGIFGGTEEDKNKRRAKYLKEINDRNRANNWNILTNSSFVDSDGNIRVPYFKTPADNTFIGLKNIAEDLIVKKFFPEEKTTLLNRKRLMELQGLLKNVGDLNSMPPALNAIRGYQDNFDNFYKTDIWKGMDYGSDKSLEQFDDTPSIYKKIGDVTGMSPVRTEFAVESFTTKNNPFYLALEKGLSMLSEYADPELKPVKQELDKSLLENIKKVPFANRFIAITDPKAGIDKSKEIQQAENRMKGKNNLKLSKAINSNNYIEAVKIITDTANVPSENERLVHKFINELKRRNVPSEIINLTFLGTKARANALYDVYLSHKYDKQNNVKLNAKIVGGIITPDIQREIQSGDYDDDFKKFINGSK